MVSGYIAQMAECQASGETNTRVCENAIDGSYDARYRWVTKDFGFASNVWLKVNFTSSYLLHSGRLMQIANTKCSMEVVKLTFSQGETIEVNSLYDSYYIDIEYILNTQQ